MSDRQDNPTAAFDDDRLLDFVLGLEDDPELAAALATSAPLRERLADLKADLAAIETELRETIPPVDTSYAEPHAGRWPRLQAFFGGERVRRRPLRGRRLTAALAAAVVLVALLIGLVSVLPRLRQAKPTAASADHAVRAPESAASGAFGPASNGQSSQTSAAAPYAGAVSRLAARYRDVAVVRAGTISGRRQTFAVARVLKGAPPAAFTLVVAPGGTAATPGSLQLAFLQPGTAPASGGATPAPSAAATATQSGATTAFGPPVAFRWRGRHAVLVSLPGAADAAGVRLP